MTQTQRKPLIAIIGRTNVGKSTLFNRLAEKNKALVSAIPGTTRDRNFADCVWRGRLTQIIDTGGIEKQKKDDFEQEIEKQAKIAGKQADLIFFLVDAREGLTQEDVKVAAFLRKIQKPVILVANKADSPKIIEKSRQPEWRKLGLGDPVPISSANGSGVGDLLDIAEKELKKLNLEPQPIKEIQALKIAIVGKPNVGKSSLVNALCGEERMIVSDIAFTTREPQDTFINFNGKNYILIDTAGIRKHAKIQKGLEEKGVEKTKNIISQSDIVLLVLDISEPLGVQDKKLANLILESGKGLIIIGNKQDLLGKKEITSQEVTDFIFSFLPYISFAPIILTAAKTGKNVRKILKTAEDACEQTKKTIDSNTLDRFLKSAIKAARPIGGKGMVRSPRLLGMKQIGIQPPTFMVAVAPKDVLHPNYLKYLEKRLRHKFGFFGSPIIIKSKSLE